MEVLPTILMEVAATHIEAHRVCMDTMVAMDMAVMAMDMARGLLMLSLDMATDTDTDLLPFMSPRLTMDMVITLPVTPMATTLDMVMARGLLMLSQDMAMPPATPTEAPRVFMDTMEVTDMAVMDTVMARDLLMLDMAMAMLAATLTEAPRVFMDTMEVMDMEVMDMVMERDLLMQDTMVVPALMSTRPVLTTMDLMAMASTTMARGLLMLDMVMEVMVLVMPMELEATSK